MIRLRSRGDRPGRAQTSPNTQHVIRRLTELGCDVSERLCLGRPGCRRRGDRRRRGAYCSSLTCSIHSRGGAVERLRDGDVRHRAVGRGAVPGGASRWPECGFDVADPDLVDLAAPPLHAPDAGRHDQCPDQADANATPCVRLARSGPCRQRRVPRQSAVQQLTFTSPVKF